MLERTWWTVACAFVLAAGVSGCGTTRAQQSPDPGARQVRASQEQSEKALEDARKAQKKASDQGRRADDAQREVREAQKRLAQAQERAKAEQEKASQFQLEANQATQRASAQARESQQQASQALARQSQIAERGEQVVSGQVLQATGEQVVVRPQAGGDSMTFRVTDRTQVSIAGRQASASELRQGEDARVSYQVSGTEPTALSIQVLRTEAGAASGQTSTGSSGEGARPPEPAPGTTGTPPGAPTDTGAPVTDRPVR